MLLSTLRFPPSALESHFVEENPAGLGGASLIPEDFESSDLLGLKCRRIYLRGVSAFLPLRSILRVESSMCVQVLCALFVGLGSRSGGGNNAILIRVSSPCQLGHE